MKNIITHKKRKLSKTNTKNTINKRKITKKLTRKRKIMKGGEEEKEECPICYEELNDPNNIITLSCRHKFHKTCMYNVCNSSSNRFMCLCPLCRKELTHGEMEELDFSPGPITLRQYNLPPYLFTINEFKEYINTKLRAPTRLPLDKLNDELFNLLGTDCLPAEIYDEIMEFDLQQVGSLYRYRFSRIVQNIPYNRLNKKYFVYTYYNDETGQDNIHDDGSMYAYDVYEV
jgi:hypothetical protein